MPGAAEQWRAICVHLGASSAQQRWLRRLRFGSSSSQDLLGLRKSDGARCETDTKCGDKNTQTNCRGKRAVHVHCMLGPASSKDTRRLYAMEGELCTTAPAAQRNCTKLCHANKTCLHRFQFPDSSCNSARMMPCPNVLLCVARPTLVKMFVLFCASHSACLLVEICLCVVLCAPQFTTCGRHPFLYSRCATGVAPSCPHIPVFPCHSVCPLLGAPHSMCPVLPLPVFSSLCFLVARHMVSKVSAECGPSSTQFGPSSADILRIWPNVRRVLPRLDRIRPNFGTSSTTFGRTPARASFEWCLAGGSQTRPKLAQC